MKQELDFLKTLTVLGHEKRVFFGIPGIFVLVAAIYSLLIPVTYTAKTVLMPPQQQGAGGGASAVLDQLGPLASLAGGSIAIKSSSEMYAAFFRGDTIRDQLVDKFSLMNRYHMKSRVAARTALGRHVRVTAEKLTGLIAIEVDDENPQFAADLANAHVESLSILLGQLATSEAHQRRKFFEKEIDKIAEKPFRDIRVQEMVLGGLIRQLEVARIDEAREKMLIQQVDVARPPDLRSGPQRGFMVKMAGLLGLLLGAIAAIKRNSLRDYFQDSVNFQRIVQIKCAWFKI